MNKLKRIALIGGSGFVGSYVAPELTRQGYATRILTRHRERHRQMLVLPTCDIVQANVHDPKQLREALAGCDGVINLAGILNESSAGNDDFEAVHVELVRQLAGACRDMDVSRLVHMCSLGATAEGPSLYLSTKQAGEHEAFRAAEFGVQVTSMRPSVIFGPGDSFFARFAQLLRFSPGILPLACPDAKMSPVYIKDVARAFADCLEDESTVGHVFELAGPKVYTLRALVEYTARVAGLDRDVWGLSDGLSRLQATVMGAIPGKPFSLDNYRSLQVDSILSGPNGLARFDIQPTDIETIVPQYIGLDNREGRYSRFRQDAARR